MFKWSYTVSHTSVGFHIKSPLLARSRFSREELDISTCPSYGDRGRAQSACGQQGLSIPDRQK